MTIEILYFADCPNYVTTVERVREALQVERTSAEIRHMEVPDGAAAAIRGFLGSPSIRINGVDIDSSSRFGGVVGMCCRTYTAGGVPSTELICQAIRELRDVGRGDWSTCQ
jgi:hypothetical protein